MFGSLPQSWRTKTWGKSPHLDISMNRTHSNDLAIYPAGTDLLSPLPRGEGKGGRDESAHCSRAPPHPPSGHPLPLPGGEGRGKGVPAEGIPASSSQCTLERTWKLPKHFGAASSGPFPIADFGHVL